MDCLTILEISNLINVCMASFTMKNEVPYYINIDQNQHYFKKSHYTRKSETYQGLDIKTKD